MVLFYCILTVVLSFQFYTGVDRIIELFLYLVAGRIKRFSIQQNMQFTGYMVSGGMFVLVSGIWPIICPDIWYQVGYEIEYTA